MLDTAVHSSRLIRDHVPAHVDCDVLFVTATRDRAPDAARARDVWLPHVGGAFREVEVDCRHADLLGPQALGELGPVVAAALDPAGRK
ncbi:hypothetical protein AB0L75_02110 [Streptomyces sp. NPDC052101]|uniref:hypothetical protein n=1 Tax=Streptomyces sp. NPDC052101 TaxID=3155763 RepID=UPI003446FC40